MRIVLGIGGGIAAYKAALLLRLFTEAGHDVVPVPTPAALEFVGAPTFEALSGHAVRTSVFEDVEAVNHVRQAERADLVVVAPATADLLARLAHGRADDLLTATVLTARCPVVLAPAMHTQMWENPATRANVATLRSYGHTVIDPAVGRLTGPDSGAGRLPEPEEIFRRALGAASSGTDEPLLAGRKVLVTAGGTREPLDPVRFLGNRSSGKQGIAVARAALAAGAQVRLLLAHTEVPDPAPAAGLEVRHVSTALQLQEAVRESLADWSPEAVVMAAAVADFRPARYEDAKIKKDPRTQDAPAVDLVRNPDILRGIVEDRGAGRDPLIVGFAAETGSPDATVEELGRAKLASKGCDLLVLNEVGTDKVFGRDDTAAHILAPEAPDEEVRGCKDDLARALVRRIASHPVIADPQVHPERDLVE